MIPTQIPALTLQKEAIGHFTIERQGDTTRVHYRRSPKDWLDIVFYLVPGSAAAAFVVFLVRRIDAGEWVHWIIAALFSFFALLKLAEGFVRLTQATRSVVVLEHREKKLIARYPYLRRTVIDMGDISQILLKGQKERMQLSSRSVVRTYCNINVLDKYGVERTILSINPTQVFLSERKIETGAYQTGQKLAKLLAKATEARYQWKGYQAI